MACVIPPNGSLLSHSVTGVSQGNYGMASLVPVTIPSDENDRLSDSPPIIGVWRTCLPEITQRL
ncbi:hypothetical protein PAHAL_4G017100 [Panicum hallii]|uniref:Uncharacterized protein n=1 Tax=Panicum hallii TaxID=206008 RepID=A0A2S3HGF3_9POAL|nr:hypothetical protein PAHAL_4G017100 [Panicum hallii]